MCIRDRQQLHKYKNLLNREFHADKPNSKWVTDISYIPVSYTHLDVYKRQEYGKATPETMEKARQVLEGEVKSYDYFLTGQCYGFQLFREDVEVDSCWGCLLYTSVKSASCWAAPISWEPA